MKNSALAIAALILAINPLLGFVEISRGELFLETQFQVQHDNNITGNIFKESDTIYSVNPELRYQRKGRGQLDMALGVNFLRFNEFTQFDSEDLNGEVKLEFPAAAGSPFSGDFSMSYMEDTEVDQFVNDRIASETTQVQLNGQYRLRQRLSLRGNIDYYDRISVGYSNLKQKSAMAGILIHDLWQDVGLTADYRIRKLTTSGDIINRRNDKDDAIFIGLTGQLLPEHIFNKLEAYAALSYQQVDSTRSGGADQDLIGYDGQISWDARASTKVNLKFSRDLFLTVNDEIIKYHSISLGLDQMFSRLMTGSLYVTWRDVTYTDFARTDDRFGVDASLAYILGRNWTAGASLSYQDGNSSFDFFDFERFVSSVFTTFRF